MNVRTLFTISAVASALSALTFLFTPQQALSLHMGELLPASIWLARELGGAVIGYAVLAWMARDVKDPVALKAILWAFFVSWAAGFIVAVLRQASGAVNSFGWGAVIVFGLFAVFYGLAVLRRAWET